MSEGDSTSTLPDQKPPGPFDQPKSHRTLAIEVEGRRFWLSRELLADYSPVFETMLYGEFAEAKKDVIELPDKKAADFEECLLCLIPSPMVKEIDFSNVELMLAFAKEYLIDDLRRRSIDALIDMTKQWADNDQRMLKILRIAYDYRLIDALKPIVKKCAFGFEIVQLQPTFEEIRVELVAALSLYKNEIPRGRRCKFEYYSTLGYCNLHKKNLPYLACIYCKTGGGCSQCVEEKSTSLTKPVCGMTGISNVETAVHELLDRLADK